MVVTILLGAKAVAGRKPTARWGCCWPTRSPRSRVLAETVPMVLFGGAVGLATFAGIAAGNAISGLRDELPEHPGDVGSADLDRSAVRRTGPARQRGHRQRAHRGCGRSRLAVVAHVVNALAELSDAGWGALSPFHYYLGSDPMINGMNWTDAGILTAITLVLLALAFPAFNRRDLRQHG